MSLGGVEEMMYTLLHRKNYEIERIVSLSLPFQSQVIPYKSAKIRRRFDTILSLLDPGRWPHPEIPSHQMIWILIVVCLQFMGDYWLRHIRPDQTEEFAREIDEGLNTLFQMNVGIDTETWSEFARERTHLPIKLKGCDLREAEDRRHG